MNNHEDNLQASDCCGAETIHTEMGICPDCLEHSEFLTYTSMIDFYCPECKAEKPQDGVTIRAINGKIRYDVQCDECGEYMDVKNPKSGCANFSSNSMGQL